MRYLLIGGLAVIYHGYPRLTGDVEVLYDCSAANVDKLWQALLEFWGGSVPSVDDPRELRDPDLILQFGRPPNRIDLIASLKSVPFEEAWSRRVSEEFSLGNSPVPVFLVSLTDLRRSKVEAGRPKDLDDLDHLPR